MTQGQFRAVADGGVAGQCQEQEQVPGTRHEDACEAWWYGLLLDGRDVFCKPFKTD